MRDPISVIETTYSLAGKERAWLADVAEILRKNTEDSRWSVVHSFDARSEFVSRSMACLGTTEDAVRASCELLFAPLVCAGGKPLMFHNHFIMTLRHFPAVLRCRGFEESRVRAFEANMELWLRMADMADELFVNAQDPSRIGCAVAIPLRRPGPLHPREEHRWGCLAAHLASAFRIRRQLEGLAGPVDRAPTSKAIFDPDGRLQHAEPETQELSARTALRLAVQALDHARGPLRRESPEEALSHWQALVAGRWSLVDHFDTDGRRFVVAHRNDPSAPDHRGLTLRERQVLAYASLGHSNKVIAYELGLSLSTVSTHLSRARAKLQTPLGAVVPMVASEGQN